MRGAREIKVDGSSVQKARRRMKWFARGTVALWGMSV